MTRTGSRRRPATGMSPVQAFLGPRLDRRAPAVFRVLRHRFPVVTTPWFAMVVRDADVRQVLGRHDTFSVDRYTHKVTEVTGPFALGFDDEDHYVPARDLVRTAIRDDDVPRLAGQARDVAREVRAGMKAGDPLDVVGDFVDPVLAMLVAAYLGVSGLSTGTLFHWSRTVFTEIFVSGKPFVRPAGIDVVQAFRGHIDELIVRRKEEARLAPTHSDDVLDRLLAAGVPDPLVCGTLLGLVVAWIPNTSKMLALMLDELLDRPEQLALAQEAARRGDEELLGAILFEAARFRPPGPGIFRTSTRPCQLGSGGSRPKAIRAGLTVFAATASAMMDEDAVEAPQAFRAERPRTEYLHFGYGRHACAGQAISGATIPAIARVLLEGGDLRRAAGRNGRLAWRYPYPAGLRVVFDTEPARDPQPSSRYQP